MTHHPSKRSRTAFEKEDTSPYLIYGTPFEAPDPKSRDNDAFLPVWKQEVVDERGRKRLHGAFQGGFSAGCVYSPPPSLMYNLLELSLLMLSAWA
ncbi:hypothetical protein ABW21_db0205241 [Orbilia brochopaga]|nr:hypothetical protein ABW21_db0205241 [Drechslerella brochopaga]